MNYEFDKSWWPNDLNKWGFNPRKPMGTQAAKGVSQLIFILGGPIIMLFMIAYYRVLVEDETLYKVGLACIVGGFLASFLLVPGKSLPRKLSLTGRFLFRTGLGLSSTGWIFGLGGIANGYDTPIFVRDLPVVAKHETLERDPARRAYLVSARPWPGSRRVQDLDAPVPLYDSLAVPVTEIDTPPAALEAMPDAARIRLLLGKGRFGLDWISSLELPKST